MKGAKPPCLVGHRLILNLVLANAVDISEYADSYAGKTLASMNLKFDLEQCKKTTFSWGGGAY